MAVQVNGTTLQAPSVPGLTSLQAVSAWTLMGWYRTFKPNGTRNLIDMSGGGATGTRAALTTSGTGQLIVQARSLDADALQQFVAPSGNVVDGELFHYAGVCDYVSKIITIYKNGVSLGAGPIAGFGGTATSNTPSTSCLIGADSGGTSGFGNGIIDDLRIYNRALGPGEISTIASLYGQDKLISGLTNRYIFNEGPNGSSTSAAGAYVDYGSNRRNANGNGGIFAPSIIRFRQGRSRQSFMGFNF